MIELRKRTKRMLKVERDRKRGLGQNRMIENCGVGGGGGGLHSNTTIFNKIAF